MKFVGTVFLGVILLFYSSEDSLLESLLENGELRVATRYGLTTYYEGPNGKAGLEYELAKRFADELGVKLHLVVTNNVSDILHQVASHQVHFAAAGLTVTKPRESAVRFGPHYQEITQQLVYHRTSLYPPPSQLAELTIYHQLNVVAGSHQIDILNALKKDYPHLTWKEVPKVAPSDLVKQVSEKKIEYALIDSNEVAQMRRFYPELKVGIELPEQNHLAWAFPRSGKDKSLYLASIQFFNQLQRSGELEQLIERHYGHIYEVDNFDYVNIRTFHRRIKERLPLYQEYFETVAAQFGLDWRFLAAIGYQESKWNTRAVSPTGVRGLMMLTQSTAEEMGVKDRKDPFQSIQGGTKYFVATKKRIPKEIPEPDRTWFALAAYNVGLGHVRDVRKLTEQLGDNPNRWVDVKKHLPKLTEPQWYNQTRYGYARGHEPVRFVTNIRRFYDILVMADGKIFSDQRTVISEQ
ncbi:MAG TPA: membrane-bound lytic murein transglycosylase MltF [Thioploca sp.]|nr:MAG: membrane-bound lytic murein transglycosylase MltF [Gammaproteobacteria bacterium]HDN27247.1 membrane-bound lytic murein transglycosylase MltF [Thioploca sp.]